MKKLNKKRAAFLTACVVSAVANMGFAAEAEDMDVYEGADYVVTATKTQIEKKEVPQSVEVITREEIQNMGAITMQDALRTATNFEISDAGMTGNSFSMRGGSTTDVLILLNGRRIPGEGSGGQVNTNTYVLSRLNVANVERIEILRGPVGAIYGSEAKDGVINIITKKSTKASTTIGVATGTKTMSNYYHFDSGKQGKVSAVLDANFTKDRYFRYKDASMSRYFGPRQNYSFNMDYDMTDDDKLNLYMDYENTDQQAQYFQGAMGSSGAVNYTSPYRVDRRSMALTYDGKRDKHNFTLATNYGILKKNSGSAASTKVNHSEYESWQFEARDTVELDANNKLTFGAEYKKEGRTDSSVDRKAGQYSYFIHDELRVGDKLLVIPAIRLDKHDEFGGQTSPSLGATYAFTENSRFKANYGKGFRAPTVYELYGTMMGMINIGNADLKPEKSEGYELSYEQEFGKTNAKLTYFKNDKKDAISLKNMGGRFNYKYVNIAEASAEGVEFEVKQDLSNGFSLTGNYNWLDSIDKSTGERNDYSAKNTFMLKLQWDDPANTGWSVEAWNKWYSNYMIHDENSNPKNYSINTFNFVVNKRWGEKYRAYFGLDNAFNKELTDMYYSGRIWRVGAEMTF